METTLSQVPYFVEAMRNWAIDAGFTPHILIDANDDGVNLPFDKINNENGLILLNIHNRAIRDFEMNDEWIMFGARFSRQYHQVDLPVESVISVIVPETNDKVVFRDVTIEAHKVDSPNEDLQINDLPKKVAGNKKPAAQKNGRPYLTLVE